MLSKVIIAVSAVLAGSVALAADLTVAQITEKNAAARGGLASWRAVKTLTMTGEMDAGGKADAHLPYTMSLKRPHMSRLEIRFENQPSIQTFDGTQGWKYRPFMGRPDPEPLTADELKVLAASDELDGALIDADRKGVKVELVGTEKVEGKNNYHLRLTKAGGVVRNLWVDATTFLDTKVDGEPRKLDGHPHKVETYYRDYKTESGLNIAHTLETVAEGVKGSRKITIKTVTVNPKLDDALFGKPQPSAAASAAKPTK
jgi:outer membrane lipoprotein-sorting protein